MPESSSPKYLFLSDVHLGGFSDKTNKEIEKSVIHLIDFCEENDYRICILGDLFDYWMEYPNTVPELGKKLLDRFKTYNNSFLDTLYITGNHDNWTFGYFKSLGFDVEKNKRVLEIQGLKTLLMHGDGLDNPSMNLSRPPMHRLLRNATFVKLYQRIFPPKTGLWLMKRFSDFTRSTESRRLEQDRLNDWSKAHLQNSNIDIIICGHDHSPRIKKFDFGTFINLGTFYKDRTVATYNKGQFNLVVWSDQSRELNPFQISQQTDE
ncbi:MAG: metallophosphoesterase family protein [Balneolaceae bacterium]|nr:metallophosphoesterase family protein [Balneolaceae bacterium]